MKRKLRLFVLSSLFLLITNPCFALTDYYVDFANGTDAPRTCTNAAGDECKTIQYALDIVTAAAGGSRINVEYDDATYEQDHTATIDADINVGTADNPIIVQGYSVTVGDGVRAVVDAQSTAVSNFSVNVGSVILKDLIVKGSTGDAISALGSGDGIVVDNVKILNAGDDGFFTTSACTVPVLLNCEITGTTGNGVSLGEDYAKIVSNFIHDVTTIGLVVASSSNSTFIDNVIDTSTHNFQLGTGDRALLMHNTCYNATGAGNDNFYISSAATESVYLINNIFNTAADDSVDLIAGSSIWFYYNNVIATKNVSGALFYSSGESTADPQFESAAGQDFNIGANMDDIGFLGPVSTAGSTTNNVEPGVVPYEETAGGGGGRGARFIIQ